MIYEIALIFSFQVIPAGLRLVPLSSHAKTSAPKVALFLGHACPLALTFDELITLDACSHHARHPRRAQAVLGHHRGQTLNQLAASFAVCYATVHGWLNAAWCDHGLAGLLGGKRAGRLPRLPPAAKKK